MRRSDLGWIIPAIVLLGAASAAFAQTTPAFQPQPANCRNTQSFESWLAAFKKEAAEKGISASAMNAASPYLTYEQRIIGIDRGQRFFAQNFLDFSGKLIPKYRLDRGAQLIKKYQPIFARIDKEYGVPAAVIVAFWGLESDFGAGQGKDQALRSLATLAYDCRRGEMFRGHLLDAIRLIQRGDLTADGMIGSWAGELGQTQMMPSEYYNNAIDYDGDGRRDLIRSVPDVLGSTGKYLVHLGWKRGEPWLQEVRVPQNLPWEQADVTIQHPRSKWASMGVRLADGKALPNDELPASLVLPMGRLGPAFLAYNNFQAYLKWNQSLAYSLTAAYYATRLAGAPVMQRGDPNLPKLSIDETRTLQQILAKRGYDVGRIDGILGEKTRVAVRDMQLKLKMPADAWPTPDFLARLQRGG
jgi:lytic murein transglycosylase